MATDVPFGASAPAFTNVSAAHLADKKDKWLCTLLDKLGIRVIDPRDIARHRTAMLNGLELKDTHLHNVYRQVRRLALVGRFLLLFTAAMCFLTAATVLATAAAGLIQGQTFGTVLLHNLGWVLSVMGSLVGVAVVGAMVLDRSRNVPGRHQLPYVYRTGVPRWEAEAYHETDVPDALRDRVYRIQAAAMELGQKVELEIHRVGVDPLLAVRAPGGQRHYLGVWGLDAKLLKEGTYIP